MRSPLTLVACSALVLLAVVAAPASAATWVVDAAGGGDFTSLQAAIDAVQPGDVLLVQDGTYGAITLDVDLSILGEPGTHPRVAGASLLVAPSLRIAGLAFDTVDVIGASGLVLLDDIVVTGFGCAGMLVEDCAQVHVERSLIHGKDGDASCESRALRILDSNVTLTGCTVIGGTGWGDDFIGYPGQEGLDILGDSYVLLSQTSVIGGDGGTPEILFGGQGGTGAEAIRLNGGDRSAPARCIVRGNDEVAISGGHAGLGIGGADASGAVVGWGTLTISGVTWWPESFGPVLDVVMPEPAQPFLHLMGEDGPLAFKRLNLHGPAGALLLLFLALDAPPLSLPGPVDGPIWIDLGTPLLILPVTLLGQDVSENLTFQMPPVLTGLEGVALTFQGFTAGLGATGNHLASNPVHILVR